MKKLLFFILLFFVGVTAAFAQAPTHEQLTYQTVVRNAQNQLVFNQDNVTVKVYVCSDAAGTNVVYSETHTGLSTNANGMLSMMIGSVAPDEGTWADIDWSTAYIKTTISYNPGSGTVTITHNPAPVTAVPYALSAGNTSNITNLIGDAIHDSITNNISNQIHDSIVYNIENTVSSQIHDSLTNALNDYNIQNCDDVNACVATAIADGSSDINHLIDTVVVNNVSSAIADGNSDINHAIDTVVINNIGDALADGNSDINHAIDTIVLNNVGNAIHDSITNNISSQIHDSLTNALNDLEIQNCDDVNDCVATAIADGNSDINHAIDTVVLNNIGDAIHDSIVNNISEQIHDSIANNVTTTNICATIESECDNVPLKNGDNVFTGTNTVPRGFDINTTDESNCNNVVVNACDLLAVFDSLCRRIEKLENAIPPVANAPTVSNVTSTSMNVKANATSQGAAITSYEFCYSTNSDMSGATCQTVLASDADNVTFTGLTGNTDYYVQYSATNFAGTTSSPIVMTHTPAHAPTADVAPLTPTKPAGFKVDVTNIDPKEKTDNTTVQVCYVAKGSGECPDKESSSYTCADPQVVATPTETENIQTISGLTPSTAYCAIVKVSNGDSTTIYGPYTVTTGEDVTLTVTRDPSTATVHLCGDSTADVTFTATITGDNASDFTYAWSNGTSTTSKDTVALAAGTHTITVTATHTTKGYTVTGTASVTIASGGTVSLGLCERDGVVSVKSVSGSPNSIDWGDGQTGTSVSTSTTHDYTALGNGSHEVTITASNASGCILSRTMTVNVLGSGSTVADRTVKPCDVGSHAAQTGSTYSGNGFGSANHGLETVNGSGQITSVTDYDGNAYPVVQIGSQCWMAENLRVSHSPKTGSNIVVTAVNNYGSKMAAWYNNDQSTYEAKRYGLLYNWCAAMDTANPSGYVEVATATNTNNKFSFTPSGNHQGVCPVGWHVPTDAEWNAMELEVNGSAVSGSTGYRGSHAGKLSTGCDWSGSSTENAAGNYANAERNSSGFSAVPAGPFGGSFYNAGIYTYFWSSSQNSSNLAWSRSLNYTNAGVNRNTNSKYFGLSVRCVRDTVALSVSAASGTVSLCGDSTADVTFTATITGDNASDFTYAWSNGTSTTSKDTVALAAGTHTITVTATHTTKGYTVTGTASVTIASGGTAVSLGLCEKDGVVTVRTVGGSPNSIDWGDGSMPYSGTVTENSTSNTYTASGIYDIVATNSSGCRAKVTMQVNVPGSTAADRTVKPCDVGSHAAQTGSAYTGNGHSGANHGLETVNGSGKITSVTDYDGNAYPVVQIGSQCWLAENLRVSHSPKTGSNLVVTAVNSYGSKMAAWYSNDQSTYEAKRYGLLYNWCAAMDTANPGSGAGGSGAYVEVADGSNNNNAFNFNPSGNHQGVCPIGWHVPTDAEWNAMERQVSGSNWRASYETASGSLRGSHAGKLSTGCDWSSSSTENAAGNYANAERNESGFSAVPAGRFLNSFNRAGEGAHFCSSSQYDSNNAWYRFFGYDNAGVGRNNVSYKTIGLSVRCVRDTVAPAVRPVLSVSAASGTVNLCGETTAEAAFTATPSSGNASDFTYTWSTGATASGNTATYSFGEGTHTVYVTATHTTESYTLTGTASVTIASGGTAATLSLCEDWYQSKVTVRSTNCTSLSWVSDATGTEVSTSTTELQESGAIPAGAYTVKGVNASGCSITKQCVLGNYNPKPCTSESRGTHVPQVSGTYTPAYGSDGLETVDASGDITSVKDIDNNEYKVVEIGSQCWMAVNLRTTKYADNTSITHGTTSNSTTVRYYYDYSSSSIPLGERGYLYNWPAAMKGTTAEGTQGVCPTGWHLPTKTEWQTMVASADASTSTGAVYLSASCYWSGSNSATNGMTPNSYDNPDCNKSGFSAVPAGRFLGSSFDGSGDYADFWSSSLRDTNAAWNRYLNSSNANVYENSNHSYYGFSVRCVRNN